MKNRVLNKRVLAFLLALLMIVGAVPAGTFAVSADGEGIQAVADEGDPVAKVGNTEYATIDDAIANWTNGTTLTLLSNVTLSKTIELSSTEHHILDLGTYTMTAAKNKDAIQIVNNGRSSASYALDIKADAENPGGITASGKAVVKTTGKSGVKDRPIIRFYNGVFTGTNVVYHSGSNGTNCPQFWFYGGEFNGTVYANRAKFIFYGGTFNGSLQMSVDSNADALIVGGTFKQLSNLYGSTLNTDKFTIGSAAGVYDREVYVDDNGYYVVAVAESSQGIEASVAKNPGTNDYLKYSKVGTEGALNYTDVAFALKNNNTTSAKITVYVDELDLADINYKGTIVVPEGQTLKITNAPEGLKTEGNAEIVETVAEINGKAYETLQAAIDAVQNGETITLLGDITENVTLTEKTGIYYTIDGNGKTMTGTITVNSLSDTNDNRRITIKNIKFDDTTDANVDFISSVNSNHYPRLTVEGCSFTGSGNDGDVAIRLKSSHSVVIKDCTGTGLHSFLQNTSGWNLTIEKVTVTDSKGALALGTVQGVTVKGCNIAVNGYGIRMDAQYNNNAVLENNTVEAFIPVVVRKASVNSNVTFNGTNTFTAGNTDSIWFAIGTSEYEENGTLPTAATGKVTVNLNDTSLNREGVYGADNLTPKGGSLIGYTSNDGIWGEVWGNASESFVIKVLDANGNVMGTTSLNNIGGIIDGDVTVSWNIKLAASSNTDEYWTMEWTTAPSIDNMPAKVQLWVDGVNVSEGNVVLNGPDDLWPVVAASADAEGKITAFYTSLNAALADVTDDAQTTVVLRDVTENLTATLRGNIVSAGKVTITLTNTGWVYLPYTFVIGENITLNVPNGGLFYYAGGAIIKGTVVTDAYYQRYAGTKLYVEGAMTVNSETFILRYTDGDSNAGIYVNGGTLKASVIYFYQGMISATNGTINVGTYWQTNETDGQGSANLVLDNSKLTVTVYDHSAKATGNSTVTLKNGSVMNCQNGGFAYGNNTAFCVDNTSSIVGKNETDLKFVAKIGDVCYVTLAEALAAAETGDTITLLWSEGDAPIAMNGAVYGKTVTITGTATVDWSKGFLFVGRGGEGNGTVIFDNANLTSASNSASYGIHVSGREKNTNNKYDGTLVIKNSTIELDYLINKGKMTLDNSTLTVKNGFAVGGRPASETESGEDATAIITLDNNSKLVVNNHNGMGLGYEAIGVMNVTEGSTFETTQSFLVTAKGTMNIAGTVKIVGTLTNNGAIVLTDENATITANECGKVTTNLVDYNLVYADGAYKLVAKVYAAQIGDVKYGTLQAAINAVQNGETITLLGNITENVTLTEKTGLYYTINGNGKEMNGTITISALSDTNDNRRITIKNINFVTDTGRDFITSTATNHYPRLTVEGCSFTGTGKANADTVALRLKSSHSVVIKDCTGTGLHSFLQNTSGWNLTIENVTVTDSKGGLALGTVQGVTIKGCDITVDGYGIRLDANTYNNKAVIESSDVTAFIPVVVRKVNTKSEITFNGTNTMTATNTDGAWCVIGVEEYEAGKDLPTASTPVVVTLNDKGLDAAGVYGNYAVATIGVNKYTTLAEAINAAQDGDTITLLSNIVFTEETRTHNSGSWYDGIYYVGDKSFTIDLGGFTITHDGSVNDYLLNFKNVGSQANTITIKNGTVDAGTAAFCAICTSSVQENQLTINLENLEVINNISNGSTIKVRGGVILNVKSGTKITGKNSYLGIECIASTVNIYEGAEIYMNGTSSYNGCLVGVGSGGTVNVYGGYGKGVKGGFIAMTSGGTINISGGEWIANTDGTVGDNSNVYVLTAQSNKHESGFVGASIINVTGGTFRGGMDAWVLNNLEGEKAELNISGGNFNADPTNYLVGGYAVSKNADSTYGVVEAVAKIGDTYYATLVEAFKAATEGCTIEILADVTIDGKWDCRDYATGGSHSQFKESVTINGNGYTIKFTGTVSDGNWNTIFRFEENATVNNLTIDISEATGAQRVITAKKSLTVDGLTIIGAAKYGIIFGEGASAADLAATEIVIKNSTLTGTRRAISDNESANNKDVKSIVVTGNTLKANVYLSASESVTFNNNKAAGEVDIRSCAADNVLSVKANGNTLTAGVNNYIYAKTIDAQSEFTKKNPPIKVSTKAELNAAIAAAKEGDTIILTADIDYGTDQLQIHKAITLDLGGKTLTTRNAYGGMSIKNNPTIKNGTIVHASNTAAIKVWNATAFEDLVIDVQGKGDANKTIGGIVLQSGSTTRVGSIKNVTIKGAALTNGIETYNCGDATENVIGSMENVTIDAVGTGMLISAPCGTATNCSIKGGINGIEIWIKGNYSATLSLVDSKVEGGVYAHDEFSSNPDIVNNGTLSLTVDDVNKVDAITLELARTENVEGTLKDIKDNAKAKVNNTYYATLAAAIDAAKAGDVVTVFAGTYAMPSMKAGITIVGEGEVVFEGTLSGTLENLTLKNIYIKGGNAQRWAYAKGKLVFENVTFHATSVYALHFDGITAGATLTYKDCTIIGWAAMSGSPASVTFDGCTFKGNGTYGLIRTYFDATIKNCTFDVANVNTNDIYEDGIHAVDGAVVIVDNCTNVNGDMMAVINTTSTSFVKLDGNLVHKLEGKGTATDPYLIQNLAELIYFRDSVNAGEKTYNAEGVYVALAADIDLASVENWEPIGNWDYSFDANFNGQGHKIMNLKMSDNTAANGEAYLGFFGITANNTIENFVIENVTISSNGQIVAAAIAYPYYTTVKDITVCGNIAIKGGNYTAGVLAYTRLCQNASNLIVNGNDGSYITGANTVGGVIADIQMNKGLVANYSNFKVSNVTITGNTCVGGISGIIARQTLNGATVENVTLVCSDARVGIVAGSLGETSTINNVTVENVTGATAIVGAAYDSSFLVVKNGDVYTAVAPVAKVNGVKYATLAAAIDAAKAGDVVTVFAGTYAMPSMKAGITIVGEGEVVFEGTLSGTLENLTLKNIYIKGGNAQRWAYAKGDLVFENVTFHATSVYALHFDGITTGATLTYKDCTIIGWAAMSGSPASVTFDGCTFKGNGTYGLIRTYFNATIKNCTFDVANVNTNDIYEDGIHAVDGAVVIVDNCTNVNGDMMAVINTTPTSFVKLDGNLVHKLEGKGTATDPYLIQNLAELIYFRDSVNAGETTYNAKGVYVALAANIDLAGENWVAIGSAYKDHGFMGNFDGNGYKILNLTIDNPAVDSDGYAYAGFFGVTEGTAGNENYIKNLIIENVTINTDGHIVAAAIAYPYYTTVSNITVCGDIAIKGGNYTAGVLAYTRRCTTASNITIFGNAGSYITGAQVVGGVISDIQMNGGLTANYSNFSASGLKITGTKNVGGISGIIAKQTLNGATVKNVTLVCSDARVGIVAGSLGGTSTISNVTTSNVTGATAIVGASYDSSYLVVENGDVYTAVATVAEVNGVKYATLQDAIDSSKAEDTVVLVTDISESIVTLMKGITLDLNGHTLTAGYLVAFNDNHVVDNAKTKGLLKIDKNNISLAKNNLMMPVYNDGGYMFVAVKLQYQEPTFTEAVTEDEVVLDGVLDGFTLVFRPSLGSAYNSLLADNGASDHGLELIVRLSWTQKDKEGKDVANASQNFVLNDALIAGYYTNNTGAKLTVSGMDGYNGITVEIVVRSDMGVESAKTVFVFNSTQTSPTQTSEE